MQDRLTDLIFVISSEGPSARQRLIADKRKGKNVGDRGGRIQFELLGRHVRKRTLEAGTRPLVRHGTERAGEFAGEIYFSHSSRRRLRFENQAPGPCLSALPIF